jgi:hypothetical protein
VKRQDKFRPSVIDPTKFEFVAHHYLGHSEEAWEALCNEMADEAANLEAHQLAHPGYTVAGHKWPGCCDCCGARYLYGATFHTAEGNTYISIGGTCASKLALGSPHAMKRFREQINTWKVHAERVAKARAYLDSVGLGAMLDMYLDKANVSREFPEVTLRDMAGKVVGWGNELSEKQQAFATKLLKQIADRPTLEAERAARDEARKPVPVTDKRMTVVGTIVSAKLVEGGYGDGRSFYQPDSIKIVVEHADGWKVWGSLPSDLWPKVTYGEGTWNNGNYSPDKGINSDALKGKQIQFDARITVSDKDCKFGFFKRPTKACIVKSASAPPADTVKGAP